MMEWQPIETAPKDKTRVLVLNKRPSGHAGSMHVAFWNSVDQLWITSSNHNIKHVSHWMPLPNPPEV
jgi:hypothetical protein